MIDVDVTETEIAPWVELDFESFCRDCGKSLGKAVLFYGKPASDWCEDCCEKAYREHCHEQALKDPSSKLNKWLNSCPPRCRNLDKEWLLHYQPDVRQVFDWEINREGTGMYIFGATGAGKTNAVFVVLNKLVQDRGYLPSYVDAAFLGDQLAAAARSFDKERALIKTYCETPVLLIDDLGQEVITKRFREGLFKILNTRINYLKPTFITSNYSPGELIARFEEAVKSQPGEGMVPFDGQEALFRRLFQSNRVLHLSQILPAMYCPLPKQEELLV